MLKDDVLALKIMFDCFLHANFRFDEVDALIERFEKIFSTLNTYSYSQFFLQDSGSEVFALLVSDFSPSMYEDVIDKLSIVIGSLTNLDKKLFSSDIKRDCSLLISQLRTEIKKFREEFTDLMSEHFGDYFREGIVFIKDIFLFRDFFTRFSCLICSFDLIRRYFSSFRIMFYGEFENCYFSLKYNSDLGEVLKNDI